MAWLMSRRMGVVPAAVEVVEVFAENLKGQVEGRGGVLVADAQAGDDRFGVVAVRRRGGAAVCGPAHHRIASGDAVFVAHVQQLSLLLLEPFQYPLGVLDLPLGDGNPLTEDVSQAVEAGGVGLERPHDDRRVLWVDDDGAHLAALRQRGTQDWTGVSDWRLGDGQLPPPATRALALPNFVAFLAFYGSYSGRDYLQSAICGTCKDAPIWREHVDIP